MKSIKIFSVCIAAVLGLTSCASSWLDQELTGNTITQEEYNTMSNVAVGTVKGIYSDMYAYGGAHDYFGQKCIDIGTDLVSSDLALTNSAYGWFEYDARRITNGRTGYIWSYYFAIVMHANAVMRSLDKKTSMTDEEQGAYAQALALRAYCYYNLANLYGPSAGDETWNSKYGIKGAGAKYDLAPIYTQNDTTPAGLVKERPLSNYTQVREFVNEDLTKAIQMFEDCGYTRTDKLYIDWSIACALYAYNNLQMAWIYSGEQKEKCLKDAYDYAKMVIDQGLYDILPKEQLYTTGFTDVTNDSWMWGLNVYQEISTALASFFGQMDVYTYSYAYAGDTKACDSKLYSEIPSNDLCKGWFNAAKKYIPDSKFFDVAGKARSTLGYDREWLNDIVYMRVEEMYLIAAEAACRLGNVSSSREMLRPLLNERLEDPSVVDGADYATEDKLLKQIYYNWRIELFAEGRALITLKRFHQDGYISKDRGTNHYFYKGVTMKTTDYNILYIMPSSEAKNNNEISY